jgi:glycerophosphoryl diester phosphodiesterase
MNNWPYPRIVAHRGGGTLAPENTLGAMKLGASMGFKGVEFDVMLEKDGLPVIIHDETLERTTNGRGRVPDMRYSELSRFDAGKGNRIPKYEDAARLCLELGLWANVEIKPAKGHERPTGDAVSRMTQELWKGAPFGPLLSSFSTDSLEAAQAAAPELPRGYLVDRIPDNWRDTMKRLECVALHCNYRHLTEALAAQIHAAGYWILLWTVNEPVEAKRLLRMGADCLVTDALDRIGPEFS